MLKHPVERVVLVEIDDDVIELSKRFFPQVSDGAFEDRRVTLVIGHGVEYVTQTEERSLTRLTQSDPASSYSPRRSTNSAGTCSDRVA